MFSAALLLIALPQDAPVAAQDAPPAPSASQPAEAGSAGGERWSILTPPCATARTIENDDIVVCGESEASVRLPLPGERPPPDRPMPSNPDVSGMGALAAAGAPCATLSAGCTVGVDLFGGATAIIRGVGKLIDPDSCCERPGEATNAGMLLGDVFGGLFHHREPIVGERVAIDLDAPPPASEGVPILP